MPFLGRIVAWASLLGTLVPNVVTAQLPGGRSTAIDQERATFRASILAQIGPAMDAWQDAWRGQAGAPVESHYLDEAVLGLPGGSAVGGREAIGAYATSMRKGLSSLNTSMLDFDASDDLAFLYGTWSAAWADGTAESVGGVVTLMAKARGEWQIRFQLFGADSLSPGRFPPAPRTSRLPAVAERIAVPAWLAGPGSQGTGGGRKAQGPPKVRTSAYHAFIADLASLRRAWNDRDAGALDKLLTDNAWLCLPGRGTSAGRLTRGALKDALKAYGTLNTAETDFETASSLGYLSGRYYVPMSGGSPRSGAYVAVFQNLGNGWRIRALVFL